jgi:hypothetical protein
MTIQQIKTDSLLKKLIRPYGGYTTVLKELLKSRPYSALCSIMQFLRPSLDRPVPRAFTLFQPWFLHNQALIPYQENKLEEKRENHTVGRENRQIFVH